MNRVNQVELSAGYCEGRGRQTGCVSDGRHLRDSSVQVPRRSFWRSRYFVEIPRPRQPRHRAPLSMLVRWTGSEAVFF